MRNSSKEKLCVVCDIGSATVSAGLVLFSQGKKPIVLFTTKLPISVPEKPDFEHLEGLIFNLFEKLLTIISTDGFKSAEVSFFGKHIDHVHIVLATPWHALKSSQAVISKKFSFALNQDLIEESIKSEEAKFEQEALAGQFDRIKDRDIRMIEREMIAVKLNGYLTTKPFEKRVNMAEFSVYMSLAPQNILSKFEEITYKYIHTKSISFHTFPLSFYSAIHVMYPHEENMLLVDVAGESTDISCVRNNVIEQSISFPLGKNSAVRKIMETFSVTEEIANSFIRLSEGDNAEPGTRDKTLEALKQNGEEWKNSFEQACKTLSLGSDKTLFSCFMTADTSVSSMFLSRISEKAEPLHIQNVIYVDSEKEKDFIELGKHVVPDPFIALEAIFFAHR